MSPLGFEPVDSAHGPEYVEGSQRLEFLTGFTSEWPDRADDQRINSRLDTIVYDPVILHRHSMSPVLVSIKYFPVSLSIGLSQV